MSTDFRVYIADLAAYNSGWLRGKHWDPTEYADADDFATAVQEWIAGEETEHGIEGMSEEMLKQRAAGYYNPEEWAIHDYEAPAGIRISEYDSLETVFGLAAALDEHGVAYAAYVSMVGIEYASPEDFEEVYAGSWDSEEDFAMSLADDVVEDFEKRSSEWPFSCIDWKHAWNELRIGGDYYSVYVSDPEFTYHIFRSN